MKLSKNLRVYVRRIVRKGQNKITPIHQLSETQLLAVAVIKRAIIHPDAELLMAPLSGTKYIHFNDVFIVIEEHFAKIINGAYSYHVDLDDRTITNIVHKFNTKLESTRKTWEFDITTKTNRSLTTILGELSNKKTFNTNH